MHKKRSAPCWYRPFFYTPRHSEFISGPLKSKAIIQVRDPEINQDDDHQIMPLELLQL